MWRGSNGERHNLCSSPHIVRVNRGRRSGWTEQEACGREHKMYTDCQLANVNKGFYWHDLGIDGKIILKLILNKSKWILWIGSS